MPPGGTGNGESGQKAFLRLLQVRNILPEALGSAFFCLLGGPAEVALEGITIDDLAALGGAERVFSMSGRPFFLWRDLWCGDASRPRLVCLRSSRRRKRSQVLTRTFSDNSMQDAQHVVDEPVTKQPRLGDRTFLASLLAPPPRVPACHEDEEEEAENNFLIASFGAAHRKSIDTLRKRLPFRKWKRNNGEFCGSVISQDGRSKYNFLTQSSHALRIQKVTVLTRAKPEEKATEAEIKSLRERNGLQWKADLVWLLR